MKGKLIVILVIFAALIGSCSKDKSNPDNQSAGLSSLPVKATAYIDDNYPDAAIEYVVAMKNSAASYLVTLNTTEELAFDKTGEYLGKGSAYHGQQTLCDTIYNGHHEGDHHCGGIPVDSLPATITDYIAQNYPGYEILRANTDTICPEGAVTIVIIGMPDTGLLKLFFGAEDVFLFSANRLLYADVPQAVKDYIDSNYADYSVCNRAEKFTLPENILQYIIHLRLDQTKLKVRIAEDGTFICESDADTIPGGHGGGHHGGGHHGGGHHGGGHHEGGIPLDSISPITDYIAANYAGYEIHHADYSNICPDGDVTEVMIGMPETPPVKLIFGAEDAFLMSVKGLPYADVPQPVKDYISANYPDYMVRPMAEKLTLVDSSLQYMIYLGHHMSMKKVRVAGDGTLICEE
jgi:hypothetical protein